MGINPDDGFYAQKPAETESSEAGEAFDLDGTLMCETYPWCFEYMVFADYVLNNKEYKPSEEVRQVAQEIIDSKWQEKPSGMSTRQAEARRCVL